MVRSVVVGMGLVIAAGLSSIPRTANAWHGWGGGGCSTSSGYSHSYTQTYFSIDTATVSFEVGKPKQLTANVQLWDVYYSYNSCSGTSYNPRLRGGAPGNVLFLLDGVQIGTVSSYTGTYSLVWTASLNERLGARRLEARYSGGFPGSTNTTSITLLAPPDQIAPTVSVEDQPAYLGIASTTVTGTATDNTRVASVELLVNNELRATTVPGSDGRYRFDDVGLAEETNSIVVRATDGYGNWAQTSSTTTVDTIRPEILIENPLEGQPLSTERADVTVRYSDATDLTISIQDLEIPAPAGRSQSVQRSISFPTEGTHTIVVTATDKAGNSTSLLRNVSVDLFAPVVGSSLVDQSKYGPLLDNVLLFDVRVDDVSGTTVNFSTGGVASLPPQGGLLQGSLTLTEGINQYSITVTDEHGRATMLSWTFVYDVTPPTGSFLVPVSGRPTRGTIDLLAEASDNLTGVASVDFQVDEGATAAATTDVRGQWSLPGFDTRSLADGDHLLTAVVLDGVGNAETVRSLFVVDNSPPAVSIDPIDPYVRGVIQITARAQDATSGVAFISVSVASQEVGSCIGSDACVVSFDTRTLAFDGPFTVSATAEDIAGNSTERPAQATVIADNSKPEKFLITPTEGLTVSSDVTVEVDVKDSYFRSVECWVEGRSLGLSTQPTNVWSVGLANALDGPIEVVCHADDLAGNVGAERAVATLNRWSETLHPRTLNLASKGGENSITLLVEGPNAGLLVPLRHTIALGLPGGTVAATDHPASRAVADANGNGIPDVTLKFDRQAVITILRANDSASGKAPLAIRVLAGTREIGGDTVTIRQ